MKYFTRIVISLVVLVIGFGLYYAGSPQYARQVNIDTRHEHAMEQLKYSIEMYYDIHEELPEQLALVERIEQTRLPQDPVTGLPYEYRVTGETTYVLCATFYTNTVERYANRPMGEGVLHDSEYQCIEFNVFSQKEKPMQHIESLPTN